MRQVPVAAALALACACGPASATVNLRHGETTKGVAGLTELVNPGDSRVRQTVVQISLFGSFVPGERFEPRVQLGPCSAPGGELHRLTDVVAGEPPVESATVLDAPLSGLLGRGHSIEVRAAPSPSRTDGELFACGDLR